MRKFIHRLERVGLLNLAGIVAIVSISFNIYQFSVNRKIQREAQQLQLHEGWWVWFQRAECLAAQRDSMLSVWVAEYERAREVALVRAGQEIIDSLSAWVERLISASSIWEREADRVVKAMTVVGRQLNRGLESDRGGWFPQDLLERPPRRLAWWEIQRAAFRRLRSLDPLDDKAWEKWADQREREIRLLWGLWHQETDTP